MSFTAVAIDVETTGTDESVDRVIELAIVDMLDESRYYHTLINPGVPIPADATEVHGIDDDRVADAPPFEYVADATIALIESAEAVIGYNVFFDQVMIDAETRRLGRSVEWPTLVCAKRLWDLHEPKRRALVDAHHRFVDESKGHRWITIPDSVDRCEHCDEPRPRLREDVDPCPARVLEGAHGALADTRAVREVVLAQLQEFGLAGKDWRELDPEQASWMGNTSHVKWTEDDRLVVNFGKHSGVEVHEVPRGYWRWIVDQDFPRHVYALARLISDSPNVTRAEIEEFARRVR